MKPRLRCSAALAMLFLLASCAPRAVTTQGREVSGLYDFFFIVASVVFVVTAGLIGWSIVRYRARPGDDALPKQFHANTLLEIVWFAIPQVIVIGLFVLSAFTLADVNDDPPADAPRVDVEVTGFQWGWRFDFVDEGVVVAGTPDRPAEISLPTDRPIVFHLMSSDVVHSFWVPRFFVKKDVVPGRRQRLNVTIDREGVYSGVCAEFCGLLHHRMNFTIHAVPDDEFESWVASQGGA